MNGLIKSPAPDENIDRTYRLPVGVAIPHYDDFVEIVLLLSVHVPEVYSKQMTNMDAFLKIITSDTLTPAPTQ